MEIVRLAVAEIQRYKMQNYSLKWESTKIRDHVTGKAKMKNEKNVKRTKN